MSDRLKVRGRGKAMKLRRCECADRGCPVHQGNSDCNARGKIILYRVDMKDLTGSNFCDFCADDAAESGLFTDEVSR